MWIIKWSGDLVCKVVIRLVLDLCVIELVLEVESILDYVFDLINYVIDFF